MRAALCDPHQQRQLAEDGFVRVRLLPRRDALQLGRELLALLDGPVRGSALDGRSLGYHASHLDEDGSYRKAVFDATRLAAAAALDELLDGYRIVTAGSVLKPPGSGRLELHGDPALTVEPRLVTLTVWCPLVDVDEENGALRVVPGSHRLVRRITGPGIGQYQDAYVESLEPLALDVPMQAGEALVFDHSLLHGSPVNRSSEVRPAMMLAAVPGEAAAVFHRAVPGASRRFEVFDLADGAFGTHAGSEVFAGRVPSLSLGIVRHRNPGLGLRRFRRRLARPGRLRRSSYGRV